MYYTATIEYTDNPALAIVTLLQNGEWSGSSRVTTHVNIGRRMSLYNLGYSKADAMATIKGGRLETFTEVNP